MKEFVHKGLRIYPVRLAGEPRWAVQSPDNVGTTRTFGDTLHTTVEDAKEFAEHAVLEAKRINKIKERERLEEEQRARSRLQNKGKSISQLRAEQILDMPISENGRVTTRRQWLEEKVKAGKQLRITKENKIKPMSRQASNRATLEQQIEHAAKVKKAGQKDVYWIGGYEISKTEYDYALRIGRTLSSGPVDHRASAKLLNDRCKQLLLSISAKLQQIKKAEHLTWRRRNAPTISEVVMKAFDNLYSGKLSPGSKIVYRVDGSIDVSTHFLELEIGKNLCVDSFVPVSKSSLSENAPFIDRAIKIIDSLIAACQNMDAYDLRSKLLYWLNRAIYRSQVKCAVAQATVLLKAFDIQCRTEYTEDYACVASSIGTHKFRYTSTGLRQSKLLCVAPFKTLGANNSVAKMILQQLGGNKFIAMTGAKHLLYDDNSISFRIGRNSGGWNYIKITYTLEDLYDMEFASLSSTGVVKKKKVVTDLYADMLQNVFTDNTGMYTRM